MPAQAPAPATPADPGVSAFGVLADRLEAVLDHETDALRGNLPCDLKEITGRKRQLLLEFSRFMPRLGEGAERQHARNRLDGLAGKLERNRAALDVRIGAVREVADIVARALRDAESDGTYSMAAGRP